MENDWLQGLFRPKDGDRISDIHQKLTDEDQQVDDHFDVVTGSKVRTLFWVIGIKTD